LDYFLLETTTMTNINQLNISVICALFFAWTFILCVSSSVINASSSEEDASDSSSSSSEEIVSSDDLTIQGESDILRRKRSTDTIVPEFVYAKAEIFPNNALSRADRKVSGVVYIKQRKSSVGIYRETEFKVRVQGLPKNSYHGFHIHQFGTIGASCTQSGGHYNPFTENHGAPYAGTRHVGDLGNILSDDNGIVTKVFSDTKAKLYSLSTIVGRAFVVHAGIDDLGLNSDRGSRTTGNAGGRVACGVIVWSNGEGWRGPQP